MATETQPDKNTELEQTKLRIEYWTKRLDHTLTHTQTSSRLIYFVDGAVLALLAFAIDKLGTGRSVISILAFPMFILAILNFLHSQLIQTQHGWYTNIDKRLLKILGEPDLRVPFKGPRWLSWLSSTHGLYRGIHIFIAVSLLVASIFMGLYGFGIFQTIP